MNNERIQPKAIFLSLIMDDRMNYFNVCMFQRE